MTPAERDKIWAAMRVPVFATVALILFLSAIVLVSQLFPSRTGSFVVAGLTLCMILTVLLFTMDVRLEKPLMKFYSFLGFCWLMILLGMTMIDYWTR